MLVLVLAFALAGCVSSAIPPAPIVGVVEPTEPLLQERPVTFANVRWEADPDRLVAEVDGIEPWRVRCDVHTHAGAMGGGSHSSHPSMDQEDAAACVVPTPFSMRAQATMFLAHSGNVTYVSDLHERRPPNDTRLPGFEFTSIDAEFVERDLTLRFSARLRIPDPTGEVDVAVEVCILPPEGGSACRGLLAERSINDPATYVAESHPIGDLWRLHPDAPVRADFGFVAYAVSTTDWSAVELSPLGIWQVGACRLDACVVDGEP